MPQAAEQRTHVGRDQLEIEPGLLVAGVLPQAAPVQCSIGVLEVERIEAPGAAFVACLQLQRAKREIADMKVVHRKVHRRQAVQGRRIDPGRLGGRPQVEAAQPALQQPVIGFAPEQVARHLAHVERNLPALVARAQGRVDRMQVTSEKAQLVRIHGDGVDRQANASVAPVTPVVLGRHEPPPGIRVDPRRGDAQRQPPVGQLRLSRTDDDGPALQTTSSTDHDAPPDVAEADPVLLARRVRQGALDPERQRRRSNLVERIRQGRGDADQVGLDDDLGIAAANPDLGLPRRIAGQLVDKWPAEVTGHLVDACLTGGIDGDLPGRRPHLHLERPAEGIAGNLARRDAVLGNLQAPADAGHRRQRLDDPDPVVQKAEVAAHLGALDMPERDVEFEGEPPVTLGPHVAGEMTDRIADRAGLDEAQEVAGRPAGIAAHEKHFLVGGEIRDFGDHPRQAHAEDAAALGPDFHPGTEMQVGVDAFDDRPAGTVVEVDAGRPRRHRERPAARLGEREVAEVALENQLRIAGAALGDGLAQPGRDLRIDCLGQVAPDGSPVGAVDGCDEVDFPGSVAREAVAAAGRTGGIRPLEAQALELNRDLRPIHLPRRLGLDAVEIDVRLGKYGRQRQARLVGGQGQQSTPLVGIEAAAQPLTARKITAGADSEAGKRCLGRPCLEAVTNLAPGNARLADLTLRTMALEQLAGARIERQVRRQVRQHGNVEEAGRGRAAGHAGRLVHSPFGGEIGRRDADPVLRLQLELARGERPGAPLAPAFDTAAQADQIEFRKLLAKAQAQVLEGEIGDDPALA